MKTYDSYKPSGVDWIGNIPEGWEVKRLKRCLCEPLKYGANESAEYDNREWPRYIRITDIDQSGTLKEENFKSLPPQVAEEYLLKKGDILFARSGSVGRTYLFIGDFEACYAGYLIRARCNNKLKPSFLRYFTLSSPYISWIDSISIQTTISNVSAEKYYSLPIPLPPLSEQVEIAGYLDKKVGEIDGIIKGYEEQIADLKAFRSSTISEAVTRGLDPNATLKPSGVDWIGNIPEGWEVKKIRRICKLKTGTTPSTDMREWFDGDLQWFTPGDFKNDFVLKCSSRTLTQRAKEAGVAVIAPANTVLIVGIGSVGKVAISKCECSFNQQITALMPTTKHVEPQYLMYRMVVVGEYLGRIATSTILPIINNQIIGDTYISLPPLSVQREIAGYLDKKVGEIDGIIKGYEEQIADLKAFRSSTISEVVTGKVKVIDEKTA